MVMKNRFSSFNYKIEVFFVKNTFALMREKLIMHHYCMRIQINRFVIKISLTWLTLLIIVYSNHFFLYYFNRIILYVYQ